MRILRYPLSITYLQSILMPARARILAVQFQCSRDSPSIWAIVEDDSEAINLRHFIIVGTGIPIDFDTNRYVGTFQMDNGNLVWHVFEVMP